MIFVLQNNITRFYINFNNSEFLKQNDPPLIFGIVHYTICTYQDESLRRPARKSRMALYRLERLSNHLE